MESAPNQCAQPVTIRLIEYIIHIVVDSQSRERAPLYRAAYITIFTVYNQRRTRSQMGTDGVRSARCCVPFTLHFATGCRCCGCRPFRLLVARAHLDRYGAGLQARHVRCGSLLLWAYVHNSACVCVRASAPIESHARLPSTACRAQFPSIRIPHSLKCPPSYSAVYCAHTIAVRPFVRPSVCWADVRVHRHMNRPRSAYVLGGTHAQIKGQSVCAYVCRCVCVRVRVLEDTSVGRRVCGAAAGSDRMLRP